MTPSLPAAALAALVTAAASPAAAHTGVAAASGIAAGVAHPLLGADHLLAMIAVGLWATLLGGRARWLVPASFVAAMAAGGLAAMGGLALPAVELAVAGSVVALGLLIALDVRAATVVGMAVAALFALFHGHAHGAEMPTGASALAYAAGFLVATALLHAVGLALGLAARRLATPALRIAGGTVAAAGLALAVGT